MIITDYYSMRETITYVKRVSSLNSSEKIKIIIVDNSTTQNGRKYLAHIDKKYEQINYKSYFVVKFKVNNKDVFLIEGHTNKGYAGGNNLGFRLSKFLYPDIKYIIFSNNDIYFDDAINLENIEGIFENNKNIGIIGPDIESANGEKQNPRKDMSFASQMIFWDINIMIFGCIFNRFFWNLDKENNVCKETGWVSGSFMFVRSDIFDLVDGFDTRTFLYAEEMILSQKFRNRGFTTFYYPFLKVIHIHRGKTPSKKQRKWNHDSKRYYYKRYKHVSEWKLKISDKVFNVLEFIHSIKRR